MANNNEKWTKSVRERTAKNKSALLEQFRKMPILQIAFERARISRSSYYLWRDEDKEFARNADEATAEGEALITDMSESQLISLVREKHFPAIHLWLRAHHPKYKEKVEISGQLVHEQREFTEEENELHKEALRLAMPKRDAPHADDGNTTETVV
jgi:hypothetical protein